MKKSQLIEGKKKFYLAHKVIKAVDSEELKAAYMKNRGVDDNFAKEQIVQYIKKFGKTKRSTIYKLIIPYLSAVLNEDQKKIKVRNMLTSLKNEGKIKSVSYGIWELI